MRAHLEMLARLFIGVGRPIYANAIDLRRQGHRPADEGAGSFGRLDDTLRRLIEHFVIVCLETDANLLLSQSLLSCLFGYFDGRDEGFSLQAEAGC